MSQLSPLHRLGDCNIEMIHALTPISVFPLERLTLQVCLYIILQSSITRQGQFVGQYIIDKIRRGAHITVVASNDVCDIGSPTGVLCGRQPTRA